MATTNLPLQLTSFIGRERELAEVSQLIFQSRLATLTGAGGCGKTRLALYATHSLSKSFADGVWFVNLVMLREQSLVPQFVAQALGVHEVTNQTLMESLLQFVQAKQMLLLLDNCEHLSEACASLVQVLLLNAPQLHILATSREPLGIAGETSYFVLPLTVPPDLHTGSNRLVGNTPRLDELMAHDAVRLFVERAQTILPDFRLTADNAAVVVDICRRLDGIPLALELASARVRVLTLEQISARLENRFSLLVSGYRLGSAPHHHTLRATMDWSYALLTSVEQILFRRLAVFVADFSLDMVEAICTDEALEHRQILNLLSSLVDKSLVVAETLTHPQARYRLLETIREYALEKLNEAKETPRLQERYLNVFVARAEETAPKLTGPYQQMWFNWLETEHDNLRTALALTLESPPIGTPVGGRIEVGLRIAIALFQFWSVRNHWQEGLAWFERLIEQADDQIPLAIHASACTYAAFLAEWRGNSSAAIRYGRRGVELGEAAGDEGKPILGFALGGLASAMSMVGDYQAAFTLQEQYIELFRGLGDAYSYHLGMGVLVQGRLATAFGKYELAHTLLDEALFLAREANDPYRMAMALNFLGDLARCERQYVQAQILYGESVGLLSELGAERDLAATLHNLGHILLHLGDMDRAQTLFEESLAIQQAQQNKAGIAECLIGFAALASARGLPVASVHLLSALASTDWARRAEEWPATRIEYEQTLALIRRQLDEVALEREQAVGRALSLDQAVEIALNLPRSFSLSPVPMIASQGLTVREREVASFIAQGWSNGEIAAALVLSKRTVEKHIANILSKLGLTNRAQLVRWAIENGLTTNLT